MRFYNYPDPIVRTTIYQAILNLLHKSTFALTPEKKQKKNSSQKTHKRTLSTNLATLQVSTSSSQSKGELSPTPGAGFSRKGHQRSLSISRGNPIKRSSSRNRGTFYLNNSDNFCLKLLMEYPFNAFFVNFVCYIRDSLLKHFEEAELKRAGKKDVGVKEYSLIKEGFLDFESQIEPMISILRDMCKTSDRQFNDFVRNIILRCSDQLFLLPSAAVLHSLQGTTRAGSAPPDQSEPLILRDDIFCAEI